MALSTGRRFSGMKAPDTLEEACGIGGVWGTGLGERARRRFALHSASVPAADPTGMPVPRSPCSPLWRLLWDEHRLHALRHL